MINNPLPRIDDNLELRAKLLPFCRLRNGETWNDPEGKHKVSCINVTDSNSVSELMNGAKADCAIHDPPYNLILFMKLTLEDYINWSRIWVQNSIECLKDDSSFYVWLGADQKDGFKPLPDFMLMMREFPLTSRSFITMRNQRGYGTQKNWMAVRQELLYYIKGNPYFDVNAEYTDIPKILRGYYKKVGDKITDNLERGKSENIRAGNVWVDIQQVFYRMEENVSGCYAQKPLKCIERIIRASSPIDGLVIDFFSHSGTTLLAAEINQRRCFTADVDPIFCEITIRRLENYRKNKKLGWQNGNPFNITI